MSPSDLYARLGVLEAEILSALASLELLKEDLLKEIQRQTESC